MTFVLRVPFRVAPTRSFRDGALLVDEHPAVLRVSEPWHVLVVRGIGDEAVAQALLTRLTAALVWVAIETPEGIELSSEIQNLELDRPPPPDAVLMGVDGVGHQGLPSIYPEDKSISFVEALPVRGHSYTPLETFEQRLQTGLGITALSNVLCDPYISLAVDLFASSFFEGSPYAQFLARMSVLEVLKDEHEQPEPVKTAIEACRQTIRDLRARGEIEGPVAESTDGSLRWLLRESIGRAIGNLVRDRLGAERAAEVRELYDLRSQMLHRGLVPESTQLQSPLNSLTAIVQEVLRSLLSAPPS